MEDKGFVYTLDAMLALTIILVLIASLTHFLTLKHYPPSEYREEKYNAEDIMELMASYDTGNGTILERISSELDSHQSREEATIATNRIVREFLDPRFPTLKYNLTYDNGFASVTIASNAEMSKADNINSAIRNYKNHTFHLYIW